MSTTLSVGEVLLGAAVFALVLAGAQALLARLRARAAVARALDALYTEMTLNTRALERWSFAAAKARRDGEGAAFAPRRAVFGGLGATLHALPKPALEKTLDFYAALESLERQSVQAALGATPAATGEAFWALRVAAEEAAKLGRAALFRFEIEGAAPATGRPKPAAPKEAGSAPALAAAA